MKSAIAPSYLRALEAIINMHRRREHITIRSVAAKLGTRYTSWIHKTVIKLRKKGLIHYNNHQAATIVPLVKFIPADQLGNR